MQIPVKNQSLSSNYKLNFKNIIGKCVVQHSIPSVEPSRLQGIRLPVESSDIVVNCIALHFIALNGCHSVTSTYPMMIIHNSLYDDDDDDSADYDCDRNDDYDEASKLLQIAKTKATWEKEFSRCKATTNWNLNPVAGCRLL